MAEEVVVATGAASPEPLDHKRKLADLDNEPTEAPEENHEDSAASASADDNADVAVSDESEAKRPRLDGKPDENGISCLFCDLGVCFLGRYCMFLF